MPLFTFYCNKCHATSEVLVRGSERPVCPECGGKDLVKQTAVIAPKMGREKAPASVGGCASCAGRGACPNSM